MIVIVDDAQLVRAAQAGDADAFEILVRRHQEQAFRVAWRMLGDPIEAEDATQDALIAAWLGTARVSRPQRVLDLVVSDSG
jgi:RNA polymerase sigma-70 factor, ECF subfamily